MAQVSIEEWKQFLATREEVHILQSAFWGQLKSNFGWQAFHFMQGERGAQVLLRRLPLGFHIGYIPFISIDAINEELLKEIGSFCKQKRCIFLKIEPDIWQHDYETHPVKSILSRYVPAKSIQPPNTVVISLEGRHDEWLARMKQKTRYNIRLAEKKGVVIERCDAIDTFYRLMTETGERDGFGVHTERYYQQVFDLFHPLGQCELFIASYEGTPLAGIMVMLSGKRAWYFYGASNNKERNLMPTYLVQWEAFRYCAEQGCTTYDLWGIPDADEETLETDFMNRQDGLWSVYRFKRGFGGEVKRMAGAWDDVYIKPLYALYRWWIGRYHD